MSNIKGEEVEYSIFIARAFQSGQTVTIYTDVHCEENEVIDYVITNWCDAKPMKIKKEGAYLEVNSYTWGII